MKKILPIFILVFSVFYGGFSYGQNALTVDLAQNHVDITTGFQGTYLQIFGVKKNDGDIAITVEGPLRSMSVRRKEKFLGAWINKSFENFKEVPSFYAYARSRPLAEIAQESLLDEHRIGTKHLYFKAETNSKESEFFRVALIRNKQAQGLFARHGEEVVSLSPNFFRTQIYMPANVPVGTYKVKSFYFKGGKLIDTQTSNLEVAQVGLSAQVFEFAHSKRFLYALLCIAIALFAGWFSNRVRFTN